MILPSPVKLGDARARHLWLPVPPEERVPCPCKDDDDQAIIERDSSPVEIETEGPQE